MSDINMQEMYTDFMQELYSKSTADENFIQCVFTETFCDFLVEYASISEYELVNYVHSRSKIRLDAWNFNIETGCLSLIVSDFHWKDEPVVLTQGSISKIFSRVEKFYKECIEGPLYASLEESIIAYQVARSIFENRESIVKVEFYLLSNRILGGQARGLEPKQDGAVLKTYSVWDLGRKARIEFSGKGREDISISFDKPLPCLPASEGAEQCRSYLLVVPGETLADMYERYGERLLEQNVRTFLQFRSGVNKGIRNTIKQEPHMFFAYNNGLTLTAENVDVEGGMIRSVKNLQIVNGGQTTAALFMSKKKLKIDLSSIFVQAKLTVVSPDDIEDVVPNISKCANTQNKINAADFASNGGFHLRIEEKSRRIWAPAIQGIQDTHWYYERVRGQYMNAYAAKSSAETKKFKCVNPKHQMFTKTDLAKYELTFDQLPYIVSKGAQACFKEFCKLVEPKWEADETQFGDLYFKKIVGKAILFRGLDKQIMGQTWYGGYKANIVTYSLAFFEHLVEKKWGELDFLQIWDKQKIPESINEVLLDIAQLVNRTIQDTELNVTQYCKQQLCWQRLSKKQYVLNPSLEQFSLSKRESREQKKEDKKDQVVLNDLEAQVFVINKSPKYWSRLLGWGSEHHIFDLAQQNLLSNCIGKLGRIQPFQAKKMVVLNNKAIEEGFCPDE